MHQFEGYQPKASDQEAIMRRSPPSAYSNVQPPPTKCISRGILIGRNEIGLSEHALLALRVQDILEAKGDMPLLTSLLRTWHLSDTQSAFERGRYSIAKQWRDSMQRVHAEITRVFGACGIQLEGTLSDAANENELRNAP